MKTFTLYIEETQHSFMEIEADTIQSAREKAREGYHEGKVAWTDADYRVKRHYDEAAGNN